MEWKTSKSLMDYEQAVKTMEQHVANIDSGKATEKVWLVEHPPLYTAGTSAESKDLLDSHKFPVFETGRGGEYTYHGPGQRVAYVMLDLKKRYDKPDLKNYVYNLEEWLIRTCKHFGITGERRPGRVGIWVPNEQGESKIAAIGVRVRKWITYHGIALNISPDLSHYSGIVPCGISEFGVTSLKQLGVDASMDEVDKVLIHKFSEVFGE